MHPGGKNFPGGGQSAGEAAERDVHVPACEQSINGSPDERKGVVRATRASCSRETGCSVAKWGDTTARTWVSTLTCSLSRMRACGRVHLIGQEDRDSPWRACAHRLNRESDMNPLGFVPDLSMRGVDNSIEEEMTFSARLQPFKAAP
jgi:hypothetical protein